MRKKEEVDEGGSKTFLSIGFDRLVHAVAKDPPVRWTKIRVN